MSKDITFPLLWEEDTRECKFLSSRDMGSIDIIVEKFGICT